jgi:hypothetical protein
LKFPELPGGTLVRERDCLEKWVTFQWIVAEIPGANIKEFLLTILGEANGRMVKNSF